MGERDFTGNDATTFPCPLHQQTSVTASLIIRHIFRFLMHTGSELLETWIPNGGFEIAKRRLKTGDGGSAVADCLVPKWADDELTPDLPSARQPCLHRIFADCPPDAARIVTLAGRYGLLTVSIRRAPAPGQIVHADALPPEPLDIWRNEIQALRTCTELWDSIANGRESATARERLGRKISEHLARVPFYLKVSEQGFRYCPVNLSAALWQRFAAEAPVSFTPSTAQRPTVAAGFSGEAQRAVISASAPTPARTERFGASSL